MADRSIGFIETYGLAACIAAADAAVKSANVKLLGYEYAKGDGMCTVKVEGNVGACKAAIAAGKRAAELVNGTHKGTKSVLLKARPADGIMDTMVNNANTVGGEIALATGIRPKGESRVPVLVKNWKPKEEAKAEEPVEEISEPPVVEEAPVVNETPEEEKPQEEPVEETPVVKETPKAEEAPAEEAEAEEEAPKEEEKPKEEPKKSNTGKKKGKKKKNNDKKED